MTVKDLKSYQILNEKHVKELNSEGILLEHKKTGARVFLLSNDDENKVFCIGFRTPPSDSTGVPHIMEHSVLCGSAKFPFTSSTNGSFTGNFSDPHNTLCSKICGTPVLS